MEVKLRKYRKNLVINGWAIMALCLWDNAKIIISLFLNTTYSSTYIEMFDVNEKLLFILEIIFTILFTALISAGHFIVGINAIKEGNGQKRRAGYLVVCAILFVFTVIAVVLEIRTITTISFDITLASILLDATMTVALADLFISSVQSRRIMKMTAEGGK
jgi:hypothetical protein